MFRYLFRKGKPDVYKRQVQVGNRIRGSRLEKGWTQERLAAEAEISVQKLRALEKGQRLSLIHIFSGSRLTVTVGAVEHPMADVHYIQWIFAVSYTHLDVYKRQV